MPNVNYISCSAVKNTYWWGTFIVDALEQPAFSFPYVLGTDWVGGTKLQLTIQNNQEYFKPVYILSVLRSM